MLHRAELGQEAPALLVVAEAVDHPGGHVVDRDVGRRAGAGRRQLLHDQRRVEPREPAAADIVPHIDAAEAQRRRLAQGLDREDLLGVPARRLGQHALGRELPRRVAKRLLVFGEVKVHARGIISGGPAQSNKPHCRRPPVRAITAGHGETLLHPGPLSDDTAAPQPPRGLVAPAGRRAQALGRRPDLAGVRAGGQERAHAGRVHARRRPAVGRPAASRR